jgi:D-lyxose ketol-isomerase
MLTKKEFRDAQKKAAELIKKSGIKITPEEEGKIDVADFGLSNLEKEGAQILTFFNTKRVSAKVLVLFPYQTEPEHWHVAVEDDPGKEETIRVIDGTVYFYIPGEDNLKHGLIPEGKEEYYTVRHELVLKPGDQITLTPGTKHWFQAGEEAAVMYTFATCARDELDQFTDPNVQRITKVVD